MISQMRPSTIPTIKTRSAKTNDRSKCSLWKFKNHVIILIILEILKAVATTNGLPSPQNDRPPSVQVNKCCEKHEIIVDGFCAYAKEYKTDVWKPIFTGYNGESNVQVPDFKFSVGMPDCGRHQQWPIFHYPKSFDKLVLLPDGKLRHYTINTDEIEDHHEYMKTEDSKKPLYYDYLPGQYCMEKAISTTELEQPAEYAKVCSLEKVVQWTDTDFLIRKIVNPIFHGLAMMILLAIAVIYFVLPTLRDLVGNIVTTITVCLIVGQAADLVRIFTEFSSHVSFIIADTILYVSLLGAFFWLNSMGYYIWKTFRSRNVFLRVTDGRKYCWYSGYAWGSTMLMAGLAIFAHQFLDAPSSKKHSVFEDQETIGWLGIAVIFTPIAFTIIVNIFFYVTTMKVINRMNTYGRIHHKLKCNFIMFSLLFLIMSIAWFFFILSWLKYDGLLYTHVVVNSLQAPLIFYVCVIKQKHVTFLLKKSCCYNEPTAVTDWGDELTYMNGGDY